MLVWLIDDKLKKRTFAASLTQTNEAVFHH